ncbi:MAG: VWA domain-containing protein [Gammaproteobacteria bacterium]|nr:VWA domain-containing protein [Gammaproteobacteria bacterium]
MNSIHFSAPIAFLLLPLVVIPLLRQRADRILYSWIDLLPADPLSQRLSWLVKIISSLIILTLIIGIAQPYSGQQIVTKVGTGAQIVLVFDRSASMRSDFASSYMGGGSHESKSTIARQLLLEFIESRENDFLGMVSFSSSPAYVLPLTQSREAIKAAISGTQTGSKGTTNIAPALSMALDYFANQPLTGSRIIMLVSDGAAKMDTDTQQILKQQFIDRQARLYWIYLRNHHGVHLSDSLNKASQSRTPELFLHQFFQSLDVPYQAYEAENPQMLKDSIAEIDRLENKPLVYQEKTPRHSLSGWIYTLAMLLMTLLIPIRFMEARALSSFNTQLKHAGNR